MIIREFNDKTDMEGLRACVIALQDFERKLVPSMPAGSDICDAYIADTFKECKQFAGHILMAIEANEIAGYATVYTRMVSDDISDGDTEYGFVSDLSVLPEHRQKGIGRRLMLEAEQLVRDSGTATLRIGVLTANSVAVDLYLAQGFQPLAMQLEKPL